MKKYFIIAYWAVAVLLVAVVLCSLGYRFVEALFIGTLFLPGALAVKYFFPKVSFQDKGAGIKDMVFITLGIILAEMLLFMVTHYCISVFREGVKDVHQYPEIPLALLNPVFVSLMIASLAIGSYFLEQWLGKKYKEEPRPVTFLSDRKSVTLPLEDILYIESNDSVTTVVAADGRRFRNKTPISQWEAILSPHFLRVHRSYLVNKSAVDHFESETVYVGDTPLPVSRKYKDAVRTFDPSDLQ